MSAKLNCCSAIYCVKPSLHTAAVLGELGLTWKGPKPVEVCQAILGWQKNIYHVAFWLVTLWNATVAWLCRLNRNFKRRILHVRLVFFTDHVEEWMKWTHKNIPVRPLHMTAVVSLICASTCRIWLWNLISTWKFGPTHLFCCNSNVCHSGADIVC